MRIAAKRLWLEGGKSDVEIAEAVGVTRPDTIRDWRATENWEADKRLFDSLVTEKAKSLRLTRRQEANDRKAKIAQALEARIVQALKGPLRPGDMRAIACALETLQRVERLALNMDGPPEL